MGLQSSDMFQARHIGPRERDLPAMLETIGVSSIDQLVRETVPASIRLERPLDLPPGESEHYYLRRLRGIAARNQVFRSYIGLGYYDCVTPSVILRNVLEDPGWYTPYTPYQAEIAQGRLESLLNFQTMVSDLTGMAIANASLLDEATAAAEAMTLLHRVHTRKTAQTFLVSDRVFPQTIAVLQSRAEPLGLTVRVIDAGGVAFTPEVYGLLLQYPDEAGRVDDLTALIARAHAAGVLVAVATDLLALALLTSPGEMGADVVLGNSQRFGVPLGYGGPHAAFFATREAYVRQAPGRIIGVSVDANGHPAYRMALQTREQHIRREKATSNICTAQALLANMAAMYAVFHGPEGLKAIATRVHTLARVLEHGLVAMGYRQVNASYFDTLRIDTSAVRGATATAVRERGVAAGINFRYVGETSIGIALDETCDTTDVTNVLAVFASAAGAPAPSLDAAALAERLADQYPAPLGRTSAYLTHAVFNAHHSETEIMRYIRSLDAKDIGLETSMIPLGSCTMKLN